MVTEPNLRNDYIRANLWAKQSGRVVMMVDDIGNEIKNFDIKSLTEIEKERLITFSWRLGNAWEQYDKTS